MKTKPVIFSALMPRRIVRLPKRFALCLALVVLPLAILHGESPPADFAAITATVEGFSRALQKGDATAAMDFLSPEAIILESGSKQTREEYGQKHLQEDIALLRVVPMTRSDLVVKQEGSAAWATSLYRLSGTFEGKEINSQGAELIILTAMPAGWRIRAIHWSNHPLKEK